MSKAILTYSELIRLPTFLERFRYLRLSDRVSFGEDRYMNQRFYASPEWKRIRDMVILRDNGCDLGMDGYTIFGKLIVHHLNPITPEDIVNQTDALLNPEYLICTAQTTHNAIHYGDENLLAVLPKERSRNDTCPWKRQEG